MGRFGAEITKALYNYGYEVLAVDIDEEIIHEVSAFSTHAIVADVTEESTLKSLAIETFDTVIIAIGSNMQSSIMIALTCKELGCPNVIAKAHNEKHGKLLSKIGVDSVIYPEAQIAVKIATKLINPNIQNHMEIVSGYSIAEINIAPKWVNKTLSELALRNKYAVNVLLIIRANDELVTSPLGDTVLMADDIIVVGGSNEDIESLSFAVNAQSPSTRKNI